MTARKRLYTKRGYWYADLRDYGDVGGRLEALGTKKRNEAEVELARRIVDYEAKREAGYDPDTALQRFASHHLVMKKRSGNFARRYLIDMERFLTAASEFFGSGTSLKAIRPRDVEEWSAALARTETRRGEVMSPQTVRHHLNALSNVYRRAMSEGLVASNPVAAMIDKPQPDPGESEWWEVHEAAALLKAASEIDRKKARIEQPIHELLATFLLTGGRKSEVLGLEIGDVRLDRNVVVFRPNAHRELKNDPSRRVVPLWPQLRAVLKPYLRARGRLDGLLFPSSRTGRMIRDVRNAMAKVGEAAELDPNKAARVHVYRHTYCAARLQTLDHGEPISTFTVSRELGHQSEDLVRRIYGHLGTVRHRTDRVEYSGNKNGNRKAVDSG